MPARNVAEALTSALEGRRLLDHPYYRRWEAGDLTAAELREYAGQYRHTERQLPGLLEATASKVPDGRARHLVAANLADELGTPGPHLALFEDFAHGVGADADVVPAPATAALIRLYAEAGDAGPVATLSVIAAYEQQATAVATTKATALRDHYGLDDAAVGFWDVHAALEQDHAAWSAEALEALGADPVDVAKWATASAAAWWTFLDERDALAPAPLAGAAR